MRTLEKNKQTMYVSLYTGEVEETDGDGFYTGNIIKEYSEPVLTKVNMYPSDGTIARENFGDYDKFDMLMVTVGSSFSKDDVFYNVENIASGKHDYYISKVKKSLNNTYYALKKRV